MRAQQPREQVREVLARFDLYRQVAPFTRCTRCNGELEDVDKQEISARLEPKTRKYYDNFRICSECGQVFWQGSHHARMQRLVAALLSRDAVD